MSELEVLALMAEVGLLPEYYLHDSSRKVKLFIIVGYNNGTQIAFHKLFLVFFVIFHL